MRIWCLVSVLIFCFAGFSSGADDRPGVVIANLTAASATVQAIDHAKRIVTVKRSDGNVTQVKVSENVKSFDHIKVGDTVNIEYYESIALSVEKDGPPVGAGESKLIRFSPPDGKPDMTLVDTLILAVVVDSIDYAKRTVTVRGPSSSLRTFSVSKDAKNFHLIKKDDEIVVRLTEAMAISVTKP